MLFTQSTEEFRFVRLTLTRVLPLMLAIGLFSSGCLGSRVSPVGDSGAVVAGQERELLSVIEKALASGRRVGKYSQVRPGDLLALALEHNGGSLPSDLWSVPGWDLGTLRGTTRFGPWGMSLEMARGVYGTEYGIDPRWTEDDVAQFIMQRPVVQAQMAAERLQRLYSDFGPRSPYALQGWSMSTFPPNRDEWRSSMEELKTTSSFARRVLTGSTTSPKGILYWLAQEGKETDIRATLAAWQAPSIYVWEPGQPAPRRITERLAVPIRPSDLEVMRPYRQEYATLDRLVVEVLAGQ
ncbi:hypothetical protein GC173_04760 [bacterium]|nr:hypothetical protein [bacterium]